MRKFSFFLVSLLCLCASTAWGETATFTTNRSDNRSYTDYTVTSGSGDQEITFTFRSKYYSNKYYFISSGDNTTLSWTSPSDVTKSIKVTSISFTGYCQGDNHSMTAKTTFGGDGNSHTIFNSKNSNTVTISTTNNSNIMSSVGLINQDYVRLENGGGECDITNITITYEIVDGPVFQYRTGNSDDAAAESAYRTQYTATANFAADNANPQWIRDYASILLAENSTANLSNYAVKISNLQSYNTLLSQYPSGNSNVDFSGCISNSNFEHSAGWNHDWTSTGFYRGYNTGGYDGSVFAEMYTSGRNSTLASGDIYQTITLPSGTYTLSAVVVSRNISSYLYVSYDQEEVTLECTNNSKSTATLSFSISSEKSVRIGYRHSSKQSSDEKWTAIDDIHLTLKKQIENGYFQNPTFDYGWTNTGFVEHTSDVFGSSSDFAEKYVENNNFSQEENIYQTIYIPAGSYKLSASISSRNIFSKLYAAVGTDTCAYFYKGEAENGKFVIFTLNEGKNVNLGYKMIGTNRIDNTINNAWVAVDNFALNTITAEEIVAANRAIMAKYVGVYNTFIESFPPAMRGGAPTINSTYLSDGDWVNDANNYSVVSELAYNLKAWTISHTSDIVIPYHYALHVIDVARRCGYDADAYETSINEATEAETITSQTTSLRTNAVAYAKSNIKPGMDVTILIENNSFENNSLTGWTSTGSNDTGVKSNSNETYEASGTDGWYLYNTWNNGSGGTLSQTLTSIPKGYYRLSALLTAEANKGITLSAGGVSQTVTPSDITENDVTTEAKKVFFPVSLMFSLAADGDVTISVSGASSNNWYKADNFTLQYLGEHPYQSYAMDIVSNNNYVMDGFTTDSYKNTISGTIVEGTITGALNSFRSAALTHVVTNSMVGQDITFMLENPDFEYSYDWNYGWTGTNDENNDGDKTTMSAFQKYSSGNNTYARMHRQNWGLSSRTLAAGDIYQSITLPAGTYKVEADIMVSSNDNDAGVTDTFYVKNGKVNIVSQNIAIQKNGGFNTYSLVFSLANETTVKIGAAHNSVGNMSRKTVAVDNFKLYYWETAKQKDLVDGYAMLYSSSKNLRINDADAKVYSATWNNDSDNPVVTLHEDPFGGASERIIAAGTVVLIYNSTKPAKLNYSHTAADATDTITDNLFVHHNGNTTGFTNYVLGKKDGENVAFHLFTGAESELTNYNVLQLPIISPSPAPSAISIVTEGNTATALVPVYEDNSAVAGQKANSKKIFIDGHLYIQQGNNLYDALGRKVQ